MEITNEEKAFEIMRNNEGMGDKCHYAIAFEMAKWKDEQHAKEKQQWIEKACDAYCKDCEYIGCDKFECLALEKFKQALEE